MSAPRHKDGEDGKNKKAIYCFDVLVSKAGSERLKAWRELPDN